MTVNKEASGPLGELEYVKGTVGNYARDYVGQALILECEDVLSRAENAVRKSIVLLTVDVAAGLIQASQGEIIDRAIAYDNSPHRFTASERDEIGSFYDYYDRVKKGLVDEGYPVDRAELEGIKSLRVLMAPRAVRESFFKLPRAKRRIINGLRLEVACEFVKDVVYRLADGSYKQ